MLVAFLFYLLKKKETRKASLVCVCVWRWMHASKIEAVIFIIKLIKRVLQRITRNCESFKSNLSLHRHKSSHTHTHILEYMHCEIQIERYTYLFVQKRKMTFKTIFGQLNNALFLSCCFFSFSAKSFIPPWWDCICISARFCCRFWKNTRLNTSSGLASNATMHTHAR